eukprot:CAMPEP_0172598166 /NCGR_PEP_ID=MMETSP1068-20121228/18179_1 /TAXON_ID=35684 /ORGANISM="Pseudopedinella elastica, Strain CCMP716" /LENGTH=169 /DNA_ID=CAMNT_0013397937 /DNA_START=141 /DNA_END=650 /DNA_ORIENTATION=+
MATVGTSGRFKRRFHSDGYTTLGDVRGSGMRSRSPAGSEDHESPAISFAKSYNAAENGDEPKALFEGRASGTSRAHKIESGSHRPTSCFRGPLVARFIAFFAAILFLVSMRFKSELSFGELYARGNGVPASEMVTDNIGDKKPTPAPTMTQVPTVASTLTQVPTMNALR